MAYPISELITQDLEAALRRVCTASGCLVDLVVERARADGANEWADNKAVLHEGDDQPAPDEETPEGYAAWLRPYAVMVYLSQPSSAAEAYGTRLNTLRAEIEREVLADVSRGGNAQNTWVRAPQQFIGENDATGVDRQPRRPVQPPRGRPVHHRLTAPTDGTAHEVPIDTAPLLKKKSVLGLRPGDDQRHRRLDPRGQRRDAHVRRELQVVDRGRRARARAVGSPTAPRAAAPGPPRPSSSTSCSAARRTPTTAS
jgi:hypothetical protein